MLAPLRRALFLSGFVVLMAGTTWAQTTTLEGDVKDQNGQPLKGAVIKLDRTDIKGHYQVKSDKKGHWLYTGLPVRKVRRLLRSRWAGGRQGERRSIEVRRLYSR